MYSVKPSRCQNNNKTKKNTCKDTDTILRSLKIRIKKGKNFCKSIKFYTHTLNTIDASWHIRSKKVKWCGCFLFFNSGEYVVVHSENANERKENTLFAMC